MQSFKRSQPITSLRIPQWDFSFVLDLLCRPDFADATLSLPVLTAKTVFLLALASGERRHAIAALQFPPTYSDGCVTLSFNQSFVPKSYFLRHNLSRIRPLIIPECPNRELIQVCQVRTLRAYCDAVAPFWARSQSTLIIPHNRDSTSNVSVQAIGRYLVRLVQFCYDADGSDRPPCRGHDVRKVAASLRALTSVALDDVLEAGQWSSPSTFLRHYSVPFAPRRVATLDRWCGLPVGRSVFSLQEPQ